MNKAVIYFLMSQVVLTMDYEKFYIFVITLFQLNRLVIYYEKQKLIITIIDLNTYIELYQNNYGLEIDSNNALKDLVLINNVIDYLNKNNKEFLKRIDEEILIQYNIDNLNDINVRNFYSYKN